MEGLDLFAPNLDEEEEDDDYIEVPTYISPPPPSSRKRRAESSDESFNFSDNDSDIDFVGHSSKKRRLATGSSGLNMKIEKARNSGVLMSTLNMFEGVEEMVTTDTSVVPLKHEKASFQVEKVS